MKNACSISAGSTYRRLRNTLLLSLASIAALSSANAQCPSTPPGTPAQLATQDWPPLVASNFVPSDFTSFSDPNHLVAPENDALLQAVSIAPDGQGNVFVLDTQNYAPGQASGGGVFEFRVSGSQLILVNAFNNGYPGGTDPTGVPNTVFYVDGMIWTGAPNGNVYLPGKQDSNYSTVWANIGGTPTGATFDGTYVWFATQQGRFMGVKPPVQSNGIWSNPVVARRYAVPGGASLSFDGHNVWTTSGNLLLEEDMNSFSLRSFVMPTNVAGQSFDGTYVWVGSQSTSSVYKFDPVLGGIVSTYDAPIPGDPFYDGAGLRIVNQATGQIAGVHPCDGTTTIGAKDLPGKPTRTVFDGAHIWALYGNNVLSVR